MQEDKQQQQAPQPEPKPHVQPVIDRIHVMIRNRRQILIDEDVKAVTSKNDTGVFDVLPEHSNFISVLKDSITVHKLDGTKQVYPLKNGIIKVKDSSVRCYIDLLTAEVSRMQQNVVPIQPPDKLPQT